MVALSTSSLDTALSQIFRGLGVVIVSRLGGR
jgi:hypothetical protein